MTRPRSGLSLAPAPALAALLALACVLPAASARAATTQYWTVRSAADHQATDLQGIALGPDGALRAGPQLAPRDLPGAPVVWAALSANDRLYLATGPGGRVLTLRGDAIQADSDGRRPGARARTGRRRRALRWHRAERHGWSASRRGAHAARTTRPGRSTSGRSRSSAGRCTPRPGRSASCTRSTARARDASCSTRRPRT